MAAAERMLESPTGERMIFRQMAQDTNGELLQYELFLPPHSPAPPSHLHPHQEERLRVVGTFAFVFPIVGNLYLRGQTSAMNVAVTLETSFMVLPGDEENFPRPTRCRNHLPGNYQSDGTAGRIDFEVIIYKLCRKVAFQGNPTLFGEPREVYTLAPGTGGRQLTSTLVLPLKGLMKLTEPLAAFMIKRIGDKRLNSMKKLLRAEK